MTREEIRFYRANEKPFGALSNLYRRKIDFEGETFLTSEHAYQGRCCKTLSTMDSHRESMRLDGAHEQAIIRPLPHNELVQLHGVSAQARIPADLVGQGHVVARAA